MVKNDDLKSAFVVTYGLIHRFEIFSNCLEIMVPDCSFSNLNLSAETIF